MPITNRTRRGPVHLPDVRACSESVVVARCGKINERWTLMPWRTSIPDRWADGAPVDKCTGCDALSGPPS